MVHDNLTGGQKTSLFDGHFPVFMYSFSLPVPSTQLHGPYIPGCDVCEYLHGPYIPGCDVCEYLHGPYIPGCDV